MYRVKVPMFEFESYGNSKVFNFNKTRYGWDDITLTQFASLYGVSRQQAYRLWDKGVFDQCKSNCTQFWGGSSRGINILKAIRVLSQGGH